LSRVKIEIYKLILKIINIQIEFSKSERVVLAWGASVWVWSEKLLTLSLDDA